MMPFLPKTPLQKAFFRGQMSMVLALVVGVILSVILYYLT